MRQSISARNATLVILLSIIAIGTWLLAGSLQEPEITRTFSSTDSDGFYLRSARILGTNELGQPMYSIEAEFAEQLTNREIEMQNVRLSYSELADVPWIISADQARINSDHSLLQLRGNVSAVSNEGFSGQVTEIRAPVIDVDPERFLAETDSRVQIRIGSRSLTATGMLALLNDNRLQLKSNVSGRFVP